MATKEFGVTCEVIDLQTIIPWDQETVINVIRYRFRLKMPTLSLNPLKLPKIP